MKRMYDIIYALAIDSAMFIMLNARLSVTLVLGRRTGSRAIPGWIDEQMLSIYIYPSVSGEN